MKSKSILALFIGMMMVLVSCEKEKDVVITTPTLTTIEISNVASTTAMSGGSFEGELSNPYGLGILQKGVCWSTEPNPQTFYILKDNFNQDVYVISDTPTSTYVGEGLSNFTCQLHDLKPNTVYYVRAFASYYDRKAPNSTAYLYGNQVMFKTSSK